MALTPNQQETYRKWKENVNMSKSELQRFYDSDEGKEAGLSKSEADRQGIDYGRESARWILKMKDTPVTEWTDAMWRWAGKQNSFISRMSGVEGPLYQKNGKKSRKHLSLLIWGHNPEKMQNGGEIKGTTPAKVNKELKRLGINGEIIRNQSAGYYYFIGDLLDVVPSIYSYNLSGWSTNEVVDWVKKAIQESEFAKGGKLSELEKIKKESENLINIEPEGLYEGGLDAPFFQKGGSISTLLAPNGQPSNLSPEQYRLVRTPEFKAWFGDWENDPENASKVVDENGEPLVQYHSSISEFNVFDKEKSDLFGWHFGSKKASETVGKQRQKQKKDESLRYHIKPYFLNIRKPYQILDTNDHKKPSNLYYQIHTFFNDYKINRENLTAWGENGDYISDGKVDYYKRIIQGNKKYDGFWYWNLYEDKKNKYPSWIAKNPNQIKLADGSNTTFDANNPDVRFEGGGTTGQKKSPLDTILELAKPYQEELTDQWAAQMKKSDQPVSEWDIEEYKLMLVLDLIKAVGRYLNATDTVKDVSLSKHKGVIEIKARVEREGQEYYFGTNMIVAGGNNIQVRHFRYLVDTKLPSKNTNPEYESLKKELKRLTGIEKIKKDIDFENKRLEALKEKLETAKINTELSDSQIEAIDRKASPEHWQKFIDITWDEIVRRGADKNYDYNESNFLKSKQEYRLFRINSWKNSYANVKGAEFQIKSKEKEIEKLNKKIAALGGYSHGGVTETLLAPNGKPSNLTPEQWHLVRTPEFKEWFGDWQGDPENASKVVDENGEPLVCYHGTRQYNRYNKFRKGSKGYLGGGIYFTSNKEKAKDYARYGTTFGNLYECFLDIKDPFNLTGSVGTDNLLNKLYGKTSVYERRSEKQSFDTMIVTSADIKKLLNKGFDGIYWDLAEEFVVYEPTQIKLADGSNTTFDHKNPDIRFEEGGSTGTLLAPNGQPSNLTPEQYRLVRTPEFKTWFGDWENDPENASKVVDENGEPLVCYHGSLVQDINVFRIKEGAKNKSRMQLLFGTHFAKSKEDASIYAGDKGKIYEVFLSIKNPIDLSSGYISRGHKDFEKLYSLVLDLKLLKKFRTVFDYELFDESGNYGGKSDLIQRIFVTQQMLDSMAPKVVMDALLKNGFDGVVYTPYQPVLYNLAVNFSNSFISFYPNQIKLADGSNTTFDPKNPDIRFRDGGSTGTLLAPNGKPSNLTPEQWHLIRTPEFKAWFGDWENDPQNASKVLDANGEPLVVFHGTTNDFNTFRFGEFGFHFGTLQQAEKRIARFRLLNMYYRIIPCFINLRNTITTKDLFTWETQDVANELLSLGIVSKSEHKAYKHRPRGIIIDSLLAKKIDGVKYLNLHEGAGYSYSVFEPNNIKLADGSNTTFDPNNPDIRYGKGGRTIAQTPAPAKDRIYGSDINKSGTAKSSQSAKEISFSPDVIKGLKNKVREFNAKHSEKVSLDTLKAVYRRGAGAYSTSHRPTISGGVPNSRNAWAMARVNAFLKKKAGQNVKDAYVQDDDLLQDGGQLKGRTINAENYFDGTSCVFDPLPVKDAIEILDAYRLWRKKKNKPEFIQTKNFGNLAVDFSSERKNAFFKSRSVSYYFVSENKDFVIRISDHWSKSNYPKSKKLNCGNIRSCFWENYGESFSYHLWGQAYSSVLIGGVCGFSQFQDNKFESGGKLSKEAYEGKREWAAKKMADMKMITTLTEEQHDVLAELCSFRHELHTNQESLFLTESANYPFFNEMLSGGINEKLKEVGLPEIKSLDVLYDDFPTDMDIFYDIAEFETNEEGLEIALQRASEINSAIEGYLLEIDKQHGTSYCPSGYTRLYADGGTTKTLLAPNGQPSNLTPDQYRLVRTPEFKQWFGDWENDPKNASKVVDENGEPLVVFHGTILENEFFNNFFTINEDEDELSAHFGNKNQALFRIKYLQENFNKKGNVYVKPFFLNIKNIFESADIGRWYANKVFDEVIEGYGLKYKKTKYYEGFGELEISNRSTNDIIQIFENNGYDGIMYDNIYETEGISYIVFNPNQIKLADGSNTTFDPNNPDIRFEEGGEVENLISQGVVELRMFDTKPEHAKEYGLDSKNPLYIDNLFIPKDYRLKGIGSKVLGYIIDYAIKNEHDVIFGHITQKAQPNIDVIKSFLVKSGFKTCEGNNDFYKILADDSNTGINRNNPDIRFADGGSTGTLLAPNGQPSNLTPEQWHLVRTSEFKGWFGDWQNDPENASKVVDANGEPLVVYHGTNNDFNVFDKNRGIYRGFYFTAYKEYSYIVKYTKKILTCFLSIKNPPKIEPLKMGLGRQYVVWNNEFLALSFLDIKKDEYDKIKSLGFDGLIGNIKDGDYELPNAELVVFEPNQIKLADGSNTTFDGSNPDIRFADGGSTGTLLAPNGKPSNLSPEQYRLVRTPEFKAWFGDWENEPENASKVVDENGEPLVVYHSSNTKFDVFKKERGNFFGIYFSQNKNSTKTYGNITREFFLNVRNPKKPKIWFYSVIDSSMYNEITNAGFDGAFWLRKKYNSSEYEFYEIVVFNSNQIKLADGSNTSFDGSSPDIRFADGGSTGTLLAPNGKPSNLSPEQWHLVRTSEFKGWFGDWENEPENASKILNENGEPLVCYHGTNRNFYVFDHKAIGSANDSGYYGRGFYFTFQKEIGYNKFALNEASYYGDKIIPCFIKAINPFNISILGRYKGYDINYLGVESIVFLSNLATMFPSLSDVIKLNKNIWNPTLQEYEHSEVSISVLPPLIEKYSKDLVLRVTENQWGERNVKFGYVKSEIVEYDYTSTGGKKGSYEDFDELGRWEFRIKDGKQYPSDEEIEIGLICDAIKKYDGIDARFHPEGYMTRYPEITDAIRQKHDCILQGETGDELVVFDSTQIKLADGSNTTFDGSNPDIRFADGGEIPNLVALHNINSYQLKEADKLGGLVTPSIAIVKTGQSFSDFGEITLVGTKDLVDPKNPYVKAFSGDIYSQTVPAKQYYVNKSLLGKVVRELVNKAYNYSKGEIGNRLDNIIGDFTDFQKNLNRYSYDEIIAKYEKPLRLAYIVDKNIYIKIPMKQRYSKFGNNITMKLDSRQKRYIEPIFEKYKENESKGVESKNEEAKIYDFLMDIINDHYKTYIEAINDPEETQERKDMLRSRIETFVTTYLGEKGDITGYAINSLSDALRINLELDEEKLDKVLSSAITGEAKIEYEKWLSDFINQFRGAAYFEIGKEKYPYSLEYLIDATAGKLRGKEETGTFGPNKAKSFAVKEFASLQDIKKSADKLVSKQEMKEIDESIKQGFFSLADQLKYRYSGQWEKLDSLGKALSSYFKGASASRALSRNDFVKIDNDEIDLFKEFAATLRSVPSDYFEAKISRAVKISEFKYAVVPKSTDKETLEILKKNGVKFKKYATQDERRDIVNDLVSSKKGLAFEDGGLVSEKQIALPDAYVSESSLKDVLDRQGYILQRKEKAGLGMLKPVKNITEIAKEKNVPLAYAKEQLDNGIQVEMEHTGHYEVAKQIALHHLDEGINYYIELAKVEKKVKNEE